MPFINKCHRESFNWIQLLGFILLVLGTVIYNEVLVIPFFGFDQETKNKRAEIEEQKKLANLSGSAPLNPSYNTTENTKM